MEISIRSMTIDDVELGMRLKNQAGWNQVPADWRRFLELEPRGCFVAQWQGQPVATTTTCVFGNVGWIAMVLVDESYRHRGIATRLVQRALEYLDQQSVTTVRLDATRFGRPVYERMGFVAEHDLVRLQGVASAEGDMHEVIPLTEQNFDVLAELDRRATATRRQRLLERLASEYPNSVRLAGSAGAFNGYAMFRPGVNAFQIGPAVATTERAGKSLLDWAMAECAGRPVFIDVPLQNGPALSWARSRGLIEQRQFSRMYRGEPIAEDVESLWASSGPEKG